MNSRIPRRLAVGVLAAGLPLGLMAASASAATASPAASAATTYAESVSAVATPSGVCVPDPEGQCTQTVRGQSWGDPALNIRSGPGTGYSIVGSIPYLDWTLAYCYETGTPEGGDPYWDQVDYGGVSGYVSDWYFFTNGTITAQIDSCP